MTKNRLPHYARNDNNMIPVTTSAEMKRIDAAAINGNIDTGMKYMHQASRGLFDLIISEILKLQKKGNKARTIVLCGSGNNGGDGLLLASHLIEEGYPCLCFVLAEAGSLKNEAAKALEAVLKTKPEACFFIENTEKLYLIKEHLNFIASSNEHVFIVDAMLGIGFSGELREPIKSVIDLINSFNRPKSVIAVDSPSGVNNDTGEISVIPIRASCTLSMGLPKLGSFFYPGRAFYGLTAIHPLGYPETSFQESYKSNIYFVNSIKEFFPSRQINGSKYDHGIALLIAGSEGMAGAAILSTRAALRSGLGMLHVLSSESITQHSPEAITHSLKKNTKDNLKQIEETKKNFQIISIGPGLGKEHNELVQKLVKESTTPIILDADGINAFQNKTELLKQHKSEILITPHEGEYLRLFPDDFNKASKPLEKIEALMKKAQEMNINILLKGTPNLLADTQGKVYIVPYGNSALATAGSGDVLTGIITGFAAQIFLREMLEKNISKLMQAAILGCFLHGKAGEAASIDLTEYSVIASDVINYLPKVIKENLK